MRQSDVSYLSKTLKPPLKGFCKPFYFWNVLLNIFMSQIGDNEADIDFIHQDLIGLLIAVSYGGLQLSRNTTSTQFFDWDVEAEC